MIDGATPLFNHLKNRDHSHASLLVDWFKDHFPAVFEQKHDMIKSVTTLSKMAHSHFKLGDESPAYLPSMGLAAVVDEGRYFALYLLGDCAISYQSKKTLKVHHFKDNRLSNLDKKTLKTKYEIPSLYEQTLIDHRNQLGTKYQAFISSKSPMFDFKVKRILKSNSKKILLYTDGYYSALDTFLIYKDHTSFFEANIHDVINQIIDHSNQDPDLTTYKRFKKEMILPSSK